MGRPLPVARTGHTPAHYGFDVHVRPATELRRLLGERLPGRVLSRPLAPAELVRVAGTLVDEGCRVGLERVPGPDLAGDLEALVRQVSAAGLAEACELTVPVGLLGRDAAVGIGRLAADVGVAVLLGGPAPDGDLVDLPGAGVVVAAGEAGAEARCRALSGGHVRLVPGPGRRGAADLAFVRCLNVLMAGEGRPGIAVSGPRLIAIAGERAAWNGRTSESWELVMPYGVLTHEQRRLVAAGDTVRVTLTVAPGGRA
jgi:proline dehydrogenase